MKNNSGFFFIMIKIKCNFPKFKVINKPLPVYFSFTKLRNSLCRINLAKCMETFFIAYKLFIDH